MRSAVALSILLASSIGAGACSGPYSGKPEKVKRPKTEKMPEEAPVVATEIKWVTECKASFQEDPVATGAVAKHKKNAGRVKPLVEQGRALLEQASDTSQSDEARAGSVKEAINKLRTVLNDAPYQPEGTYYLAVAYARARRKGCALALLKRLAALETHPDYSGDARRMINTALDDGTLKLFEKEMYEALGK
jgi:hypothetical protein